MNPQKGNLVTSPNLSTWLASLSLLFNYGARMVVPVIAHVVCVMLECDAATLIGSTASAFFVGDWIAQLISSPLVSKLGGKQLLCLGTLGWALMMFLMPFIFHYRPLLLLAQGALGLFCGFGYPSSHALIAASVHETQKSTAVSLINSAGGLGSMFGNLTTPFFAEYWNMAFQVFFYGWNHMCGFDVRLLPIILYPTQEVF
jgi:MFS family permease